METLAQIDALMSLASAAQFGTDGGPLCRPVFVEPMGAQRQVSPACMLAAATACTDTCCALSKLLLVHVLAAQVTSSALVHVSLTGPLLT